MRDRSVKVTIRVGRPLGRPYFGLRMKRLRALKFVDTIWRKPMYRGSATIMLMVVITSILAASFGPALPKPTYKLSDQAHNILPDQSDTLAKVLKLDGKQQTYEFNQGYTGLNQTDDGRPHITASFPVDASSGIKVTDVTDSLDFTMKPKFLTGQGRQETNQILYPLVDNDGYLVYSAQVAGVKEDILLNTAPKADDVSYGFELNLPSGLEARLETDGSIGVYGSSLPINGNINTGSQKDADLLNKVRQKSAKDKLMFNIPAPVVSETNKTVSQVGAQYELHGNDLSIVVSNLKGAHYPLAIDPSVYVTTAQQFMRGNNESNIDFDTDNSLIKKGRLTGGRFNNWNIGMVLPQAIWGQGTAVAGGYIYTVGGNNGSSLISNVYWAQLNTTTYSIDSPNPGTGACSSWCTNSAYNLPVATADLSLVAYNGYLYAMGGQASTGTVSSVYIAKLGANGEPSLWHPSDTNPANWVYWYQDTGLPGVRSFMGAAAYNNRMYLVGGRTSATNGGVNTVYEADMKPVGTLNAWTQTGMVNLPSVLHSFSMQIYNDRLYVIGGDSGGVVQSAVRYIKLNNDGTMAGSWASTTSMSTGRMSEGGNFSTIWGGYIYISGGCTQISGTGPVGADYCSATGQTGGSDIELASINADGTITPWTVITGISFQRIGFGLVSWRDTIYGIGGCGNQDVSLGTCAGSTLNNTSYGAINSEGDVSQTDNSVASGTSPCVSPGWTDCNIPPPGDSAGQGGNMAMGVVANNGFIYIVGGCTAVDHNWDCYNSNSNRGSGQMSGNVSYAAMAFDGSLVRPSSCIGSFYGSWCVDSTHRINGTTGLGAMAITAFNNVIYVVGGTNGTTWSQTAYYVPVNLDGSLATTWTAQGFNSLALGTARGFMYIFARANPNNNSFPGNLYLLGGCNGGGTSTNGLDCNTFFTQVYKCTIASDGSITTNNGFDCTTSGQLQIDSEPGTSGGQGLGAMAGTVYANYIYLIGGQSPDSDFRGDVLYAKIDNNLNIVSADGSGNWVDSPNQITPARARGYSFGYNGYLYSLAGYSGGSSLNDVLYAKINVGDGSIGTFTTSFVTVNPRWELRAFVSNGSVYAMGGCSFGAFAGTTGTSTNPGCQTMTNTIQVFRLYNNNSGTPAAYNAINNPGFDKIGGSSTVWNGYLYLAGGCTVMSCSTTTNNVYYAAIAADGTIGTFTLSPNILPANRAWGKLLASGGTLYYAGGQDSSGTAQSTVYYSTPNASGVPQGWAAASNGLPTAETEVGASVWNDRLYVAGGVSNNGFGNTYSSAVYMSPQLSSGGDITSAWSSQTAFDVARSGEVIITYANNIYMLGGYNGTVYMSDVQFAQIASDGTIGPWSFTSSLTQRVYQGDGFAANGYMYIFGGRYTSTNCTNNTYVASISANTPIADGNDPTGVADWGETNVKFGSARYGATAVYNDGKAYIFGGGCNGSFVGSTDRAYGSTLQSQPMISKYSRLIDTDTDVFPTYWLMNGLDNFIGARWKLKYRSMNNPFQTDTSKACGGSVMTDWGTETDYGIVTLGTPAAYTPLNQSGTNMLCGRYYYFNISIDSSQAFGYPDDVTRGPTIDDITLFFTSDPSKRLRHGATFTGGELQPLDTPPLP